MYYKLSIITNRRTKTIGVFRTREKAEARAKIIVGKTTIEEVDGSYPIDISL